MPLLGDINIFICRQINSYNGKKQVICFRTVSGTYGLEENNFVPKTIVVGSKDNIFFHLSNNKNLGKTVRMQRSAQRANKIYWFILPDL